MAKSLDELLHAIARSPEDVRKHYPEVARVTAAFQQIGETLEAAAGKGRIVLTQQRRIARSLRAAADAIDKGAGPGTAGSRRRRTAR